MTPAQKPELGLGERVLGRDEGRVSWPVKLFVLLHLFAILAAALPGPPEGFDKVLRYGQAPPVWSAPQVYALDWKEVNVKPRIEKYLYLTGTWQAWNMFAPNPADVSTALEAEVLYRDGSRRTYKFPRPERMSLFEKFVNERYRKYLESAHREAHMFLWPPLAQWIALQNTHTLANPPVRVHLIRVYRIIEPPGGSIHPERSFLFFDYKVNPEVLQEGFQRGRPKA